MPMTCQCLGISPDDVALENLYVKNGFIGVCCHKLQGLEYYYTVVGNGNVVS
jgi:hypothetical protein